MKLVTTRLSLKFFKTKKTFKCKVKMVPLDDLEAEKPFYILAADDNQAAKIKGILRNRFIKYSVKGIKNKVPVAKKRKVTVYEIRGFSLLRVDITFS